LIEQAYTVGEQLGLAVWTYDEAGPFQPRPLAGQSWHAPGHPHRQSSHYLRRGTVKLLCLFHPADGHAYAKGVTRCPNTVLHPWLQEVLGALVATLPPAPVVEPEANRQLWQRWQDGLQVRITLAEHLPPLRMLLVMDNLAGHKTPAFVLWLFAHGIMPLYTPLGGSWLNMVESVQRIMKRRALEGQAWQTTEEMIAVLEATVRGWNAAPTPFVWGGARAARRARSRERHRLGGSGACTFRSVRRRLTLVQQWQRN
jgi:hypothetical protein